MGARTIHISPQPEITNNKPGPATFETYRLCMSHDSTGKAFALYCFYAMKAFDRDEGQPYCTDEWVAEQMGWNFKTVMQARGILQKAGVIKMIRKGRKRFVQVQYLPFSVSNKRHRSLGTETIPESVMGTTGVFDYWSRWYDNLQGNPTRLINQVRKQSGINATKDKIMGYVAGTYRKMCSKGWGLNELDSELRFHSYLEGSVINKLKRQ